MEPFEIFIDSFWLSSLTVALASALPISFLRNLTLHGKLLQQPSSWSVPKRWFVHFYLYAIIATYLITHGKSTNSRLLLIHVTRRFIEDAWLFPGSSSSSMHVLAYMFGFTYYTVVPLSLPTHPFSVSLFLVGNILQHLSHRALYNNRKTGGVDAKRRIPDTPLFKVMNCPHYFAEMLIYISLASVECPPSLLCAAFVIVSLSINWRNHSAWYTKNRSS